MSIGKWLETRTGGAGEVANDLLRKPILGGASYIFSLGALNLFLFINQVVTGMFLMMYYVPAPDHAYSAVQFIQHEATFGYVVRGLHFWGASVMIVSLMLHASRVFIYGAYKKPRELMWVSGTILLFLVFGFAFTGYLLPWDQKAYWATVVGTNVAGTAPVAGGVVVRILRGGADISALTLTRFFTIHTQILPWTLALVAGLHLTLLQFLGHGGPWDLTKVKKADPFYPDQVFKDMVLVFFVFALMLALANAFPAKLEALADPTDHSYNPRPEWYFYFLFQLLHYTEGKYEMVGTFVIPNLFVAVMLLLPFIDRSPERDPKKRPKAIAAWGIVIASFIALTMLAVVAPSGGVTPKPVTEGRKLYLSLGCVSCHSINGVGGKVGPPLDNVGSTRDRAWLFAHFKDPQKMTPGSIMPKFDQLSQQQLDELTDYMLSLK
jgi:ubiquinol-cytochrome c reductase cytochrome b subunit